MKECPKCHAVYDDSMNFCTKCGTSLVPAVQGSPVQNTPQRETSVQENVSKKGGCLKKILVSVVVVVIALYALGHYVQNAATYLRLEPNQLVAAKCGGEIKVDVDYDGYIWEVNHVPDWVEVEENENDFKVKVGPNTTGANRQGTITIQSGSQVAQVTISQAGFASYIKASVSSITFDKSGGSKTVSVDSDGSGYRIDGPDFIHVDSDDDGNVKISVGENDDSYRTGMVRMYEDNVACNISVVQHGKCEYCDGTGERTCTTCGGSGSYYYGMMGSTCLTCGGSGKFNCPYCGGSGER